MNVFSHTIRLNIRLFALVCLTLLFATLCCLRAQSSEVAGLKREQDLFDARGFNQGKPIAVDGHLMISQANGNVSYSYPISQFSREGYPFSVSLNYCGSVACTAFDEYDVSANQWSTFHQNRPAWIIGLNGFALDVISWAANMKNLDDGSTGDWYHDQGDVTFNDSNFAWLINGYDFSNSMKQLYNSDQDVIRLLREDGSILELRNSNIATMANEDSRHYTGRYYVNEANHKGYALVEYDTTRYFYNYVKSVVNLLPPYINPFLPRLVHYYPGDGLEYTFAECPVPFGEDTYKSAAPSTGGQLAGPSVFYLETIRTSSRQEMDGTIMGFTRTWHTNADDLRHGRALITMFAGHKITFSEQFLAFEALGRTTKVWFNKVVRSDLAARNTLGNTIPIYQSISSGSTNVGDPHNSYLGLVTKIEDPLGRKTYFDYQEYHREYQTYHWPPNNTHPLTFNNWRLSKVTEPTARYIISYQGDSLETIEANGGDYSNKLAALNNVASGMQKYRLHPGDPLDTTLHSTDLLSSDSYEFLCPEPTKAVVHTSISTTTDHVNNTAKSITQVYSRHDLYDFSGTGDRAVYTSLDSVGESSDSVSIITAYDNEAQGSNSFLWLPIRKTVAVLHGSTLLAKSKENYEYTTVPVRSYGYDALDSLLGKEVETSTEYMLRPDTSADIPVLIKKTSYEHLGIIDTWGDWDSESESGLVTPSSGNGKDHKESPLSGGHSRRVATTDTNTIVHYFAPPVYYLDTLVAFYNGSNLLLSGSSKEYETSCWRHVNLYSPRGTLVVDRILGTGAEDNIWHYYRYWTGLLPMYSVNDYGSQSYQYYDRTMDSTRDMHQPQENHIKYNDDSVGDGDYGGQLIKDYEGVTAEEGRIRQYRPVGGSVLMRNYGLRQWYERSYFNQVSAKIDANGWYSRYGYDANGRLQTAWLPGDFSNRSNPLSRIVSFQDSAYLAMDVIHVWDEHRIDNNTYTRKTEHLGVERGLFAALPRQRNVFVLSGGGISSLRTPGAGDGVDSGHIGAKGKGSSIQELHPYENLEVESYMQFTCPVSDELRNAVSLESVSLHCFVSRIIGQCVYVEVKLTTDGKKRPFFSRSYVFNCPAIGHYGNTSSDLDTNGYDFVIDLTSVRDSIMQNAGKWTGEIHVRTSDSRIDLAGAEIAPRMCFKGAFALKYNPGDYTLRYVMHDRNFQNTSLVSAKVDDAWHTSNTGVESSDEMVTDEGWDTLAYSKSRFMTIQNSFGADYRTVRTMNKRELPGAGGPRMDSVSMEYTGLGLQSQLTDQEAVATGTEYDGWGRVRLLRVPEGDTITISYEEGRPSDFVPANSSMSLGDQDFYGYYSVKRRRDENGKARAQYYDAFDRLRREVNNEELSDPVTGNSNLQTRYDYDVLGRVRCVVNPKGDTTRYWYDEFGRVKYKSQPDMGMLSYCYDKAGNLRFVQTQEDAESKRIGFREYDDMNRLTVVGEARFSDTLGSSGVHPEWEEGFWTRWAWQNDSVAEFGRLSNLINPSELHDSGESDILTSNKTLWLATLVSVPTFWSALEESECLPPKNPLLPEDEGGDMPGPYMKHSTQKWSDSTQGASLLSDFENIAVRPQNVRTVVQYDTLPSSVGAVWAHFPSAEQWNALAPKDSIRNMRGHEVAVAYRQHGGEPFHYTVMSYDERGRVEAVIHYNENLGFDAVYYKYNSMNLVIELKVADPQRQHVSWYGYDNSGRVDSVWTKLGVVGTGLGLTSAAYPADTLCPAKPDTADIVYDYTKRDQVSSMKYPVANVLVEYAYNPRKWLDTMVATMNALPLYSQALVYSRTGSITKQVYAHGNWTKDSMYYEYDETERLRGWGVMSDTVGTEYSYDRVGNRSSEVKRKKPSGWMQQTMTYMYNQDGGPNHLTEVQTRDILGTLTHKSEYSYTPNGAMEEREEYENMSGSMVQTMWEHFGYNGSGLLKRYERHAGGNEYDWRYRYSASGEREQKRVYEVQQSIFPAPEGTRSWTYYLLGGDQKQHAVYKGVEGYNKCGDSGWNVYLYPTEYLTYGSGGIHNITTRPFYGTGIKEYVIADGLGSTRVSVLEDQTLNAEFDYEPFGEPLTGSHGAGVRQTFIDKEKDSESGDNNFGARQYAGKHGRFNSIDPLFEKYPSLSPYHYTMNNPLRYIDPTGDSAVVLADREGASGTGHAAILIGNEKTGWGLYSKNGGEYGVMGESIEQQKGEAKSGNGKRSFFTSLEDFKEHGNDRYDEGILIETNSEQDGKMRKAAKKEVEKPYALVDASCIDVVSKALEAAGKDGGNRWYLKAGALDAIPNWRFDRIKGNNKNIDVTKEITPEQRQKKEEK